MHVKNGRRKQKSRERGNDGEYSENIIFEVRERKQVSYNFRGNVRTNGQSFYDALPIRIIIFFMLLRKNAQKNETHGG